MAQPLSQDAAGKHAEKQCQGDPFFAAGRCRNSGIRTVAGVKFNFDLNYPTSLIDHTDERNSVYSLPSQREGMLGVKNGSSDNRRGTSRVR
jgi:hypothetical protein